MKIKPSFGTFKVKNVNVNRQREKNNLKTTKQLDQDLQEIDRITEKYSGCSFKKNSFSSDMTCASSLDTWRKSLGSSDYVLTHNQLYPFITAQPKTEKRIAGALKEKGYDIEPLTMQV